MTDYRHDPEYLRQRRAIIRAHHPDAGGSDADLIAALNALDDQWDRRARIRRQVEEYRPDFIPEHATEQALAVAEQAVNLVGSLANRAGKVAGSVGQTIYGRLPREFLRGYRQNNSDKKEN
ncbi:hypothetical protein ACEN19_08560 [Corynebacterium auriscanis]|uniref:hypothetical protein n=1 Tax=Corynebacterium auriscanis TaxID=99807 RepID=UPI003CFB823B